MTELEGLSVVFAERLMDLAFNFPESTEEGVVSILSNRQQGIEMLQRYAETYQKQYGFQHLPGKADPVPLELFSTSIQFWDELNVCQTKVLDTVESNQGGRTPPEISLDTSSDKRERWDGLAIAAEHPYLMVLGKPGTGKSVFLQQVGMEALKGEAGKFKCALLPVFLKLKGSGQTPFDLNRAIVAELENFGFSPAADFVAQLLEQGKLLVLLDGLDEVSHMDLQTAIGTIQDFIVQHNQNRFVISGQTADRGFRFVGFADIELAGLTEIQIRRFLHYWFQSESQLEGNKAEQLWQQLKAPNNAKILALARMPLLLAFLCSIYSRSARLLDKACILYQRALDLLLEEVALPNSSQSDADIDLPRLPPKLEKILLSEIAYRGFVCDRVVFPKQQLLEGIRDFLVDIVDRPDNLDEQRVLETAIAQQGILSEQSEGTFAFSHLTLQEFLAAIYIVNEGQIEQFATEHLTEQRWRGVILFVAGLMPRADELLKHLTLLAEPFAATPKLQSLLAWSDRATAGSMGSLKPAAKRTAALALALVRTLALDRCLYRALSRDLDRVRNQTMLYDRTLSRKRATIRSRALSIYRVLNRLLTLYRTLSPEISIDLELYLYRALNLEPDLSLTRDRTLDLDFDIYLRRDRTLYRDRDRTLARDFATAQIFTKVNFQDLLAQLLALKTTAPTNEQPFQAFQTFAEQVYKTWLNALQCQPDWLDLSKNEMEALANYLYINELTINCKESAVRVSRQKWSTIENGILAIKH